MSKYIKKNRPKQRNTVNYAHVREAMKAIDIQIVKENINTTYQQDHNDMLNSEAAAKYLGYHIGYLRLLCREGQIRYTKNKGYRFEQAWLDAFLATRQPERVAARAPRPSFKKPGRPPAVGPLSVKDVEEIRNRLLTGQSPAQIAREFVMGDERENP